MKICFTMNPERKPFGGGNQFALFLIDFLRKKGINIVFTLEEDIDLIFIMDPRILKYNKIDLQQIIDFKNTHSNVKIIHRVNDCDKPRGDSDKLDKILIETFKIVDKIIYVSDWTRNYFIEKGCKNGEVINNGCNQNYFYPKFNKKLNEKIKIVTHHWSINSFKGRDIYLQLDNWIKDKNFEFIYIGREFNELKNSSVIGPFFGLELANNIRDCDIYLSASQYENCPMHIIEGLSCGLPLLYHKNIGGGVEIGEIHGGESFEDFEEMIIKLGKIVEDYENYRKKIKYELLGSDLCSEKYYLCIK